MADPLNSIVTEVPGSRPDLPQVNLPPAPMPVVEQPDVDTGEGPLEIEIRPAAQVSDNPNDINKMMLRAYEDQSIIGDGQPVVQRGPDGSYSRISANAHAAQMTADTELSSLSPPEEAVEEEAEAVAATEEDEGGFVEGVQNFFAGMPEGLVAGAANVNDLIPIGEWITEDGRKLTTLRDALDFLGELTGLDAKPPPAPPGMAAAFGKGIAQAVPTMIPFIKALKMAGSGAVIADLVGGGLGDFATSSETEANDLVSLFSAIPEDYALAGLDVGEYSALVHKALEDFINADPGSLIDTNFRSRLFASVPGLVLTPVLNKAGRLAIAAKDSGLGGQFTQVLKEFFEDTSGSVKLPGQAAAGLDTSGHAGRISTRLPTAVKATEDPVAQPLSIGLDEIAANQPVFAHNVGLTRSYPNMPKNTSRVPAKAAEQFIEHVKDNLIWLHNRVPPKTRVRSQLWYDGGRKIVEAWTSKYDLPDTSIAGVLAALSPQKDWYVNASLAERVLDTITTKSNHVFDAKMASKMEEMFPGPKYAALRAGVAGKRLSDVATPHEKAMWVRLYDEAHYDRGHRVVLPEGGFGDWVKNLDGSRSGTAWGSLISIRQAIVAAESGGDRVILTQAMGSRHKVRNFYNNLLDPNSPMGDVTIDTHAVAAALIRPLSGTSTEVAHNLGTGLPVAKQPKGWKGVKNSSVDGVQGTYALYAEAYRRAAKELGLQPRQVQSITWEAVRGLFPKEFKNAKNNADIDAIWRQFKNGKMGIDDVRNAIEKRAGGIDPPTWEGRVRPDDGELQNSSYSGELSASSVHGEPAGGTVSGGGERPPKNVPVRGRGRKREDLEIQGGAYSTKLDIGKLGRILDDHSIEWSYHPDGGITAIEKFSKGPDRKKHFRNPTTLRTVRNWLGY